MSANGVPIALAFGAGLVASVNPCGFAMLPAFVSYYVGTGASDETREGGVLDGLAVGLVLTAGFMAVFGVMGVVVGLGARSVVRFVPWLALVIGAGLVVAGAWIVAGRHLRIALPGLRSRAPEGRGYRSMLGFGVAYAIGSLSCTLPVFLVVVGGGLAAGSVLGTVTVFLAYGFGTATVLMLLSFATAGFREMLVRKIRRVLPYMSRVSGAVLVLGGGYITYYWVSALSGRRSGAAIRLVSGLQRRTQEVILGLSDGVWVVAGVVLVATAAAYLLLRPRPRSALPDAASEHERTAAVRRAGS